MKKTHRRTTRTVERITADTPDPVRAKVAQALAAMIAGSPGREIVITYCTAHEDVDGPLHSFTIKVTAGPKG